jgi:hypothetical protein
MGFMIHMDMCLEVNALYNKWLQDSIPCFLRRRRSTIEAFRRVYIDEHHVISWDIDPSIDSRIEWGNKVDICPDGCYIDSVPIDLSVNVPE